MNHGGSRKGAGRPRTSAGWATVSVNLPLPTVEAYRALPEPERSKVQGQMRVAVELAVATDEVDRTRLMLSERALSVACPFCKAEPGYRCGTVIGSTTYNAPTATHKARLKAAVTI